MSTDRGHIESFLQALARAFVGTLGKFPRTLGKGFKFELIDVDRTPVIGYRASRAAVNFSELKLGRL